MSGAQTVTALFIRPQDLRSGEARALRVSGLGPEDTLVFLDTNDQVKRVRQGGSESSVVPWSVEQVLRDLLDPHEHGD